MSHASPEDVQKLADLARISVPKSELPTLASEFDSILAYIGQLDELSLEIGTRDSDVKNIFREDADPHAKGEWTEKIVEAFPAKDGNALSVKQIIQND